MGRERLGRRAHEDLLAVLTNARRATLLPCCPHACYKPAPTALAPPAFALLSAAASQVHPQTHVAPYLSQDRAAAMSRRASVEFRSRISALQRQHTALSHQLLHVLRAVDAMESRLALSAGWVAQPLRFPRPC